MNVRGESAHRGMQKRSEVRDGNVIFFTARVAFDSPWLLRGNFC